MDTEAPSPGALQAALFPREGQQRGPLELACRDAGLPPTVESLMLIEAFAQRENMVALGQVVTPKIMRRAARWYRKAQEQDARWVQQGAPRDE